LLSPQNWVDFLKAFAGLIQAARVITPTGRCSIPNKNPSINFKEQAAYPLFNLLIILNYLA
jgi:hypothetical protein